MNSLLLAYLMYRSTHAISALPVFAWEVSLAVYLVTKGFRSTPITPTSGPLAMPEPLPVG